jgi:hypothetical protein
MTNLITDLASKVGISPELAQKGVGVLLVGLKNHLPAETFATVKNVVPDADALMTAGETAGGGGLVGGIKEMAGKLLGGGAGEVTAKLTNIGFSAEQIQKFLPAVLDFVKGKLPPDVAAKLGSMIPAEPAAAK